MEDELKHFGVLGMKWGRRKNRSESGSRGSEDHRKAASIMKKIVHELSND